MGVTVTPHQFRHIAACVFLAAYPGHFQEAALLLGDTIESLLTWYSHLHQESALRRLDAALLDKLQSLRKTMRQTRGGR